jgi:hypothetical protein
VILFDATVFPSAAPQSIMLTSQLPEITADRLVIDASNAGVILNGSAMSQGSGLVVAGADGVVIRGLQVVNFPVDGIDLGTGTTNAIIGGDRAIGVGPLGQGNLLSGNGETGAWVHGAGTTGNRFLGNFVGTDVTGRIARPSGQPQRHGQCYRWQYSEHAQSRQRQRHSRHPIAEHDQRQPGTGQRHRSR